MNNWIQIKDLDYEINNQGVVRRISTKRVKKSFLRKDGYIQIQLMVKSKEYKMYQLHILLTEAFIDNPESKRFINHKDCNRANNSLDNLEWVTHSENVKHSYIVGSSNSKGSNNGFSKLDEDKVRYIRTSNKSTKDLSIELNVTLSTIKMVKAKLSWKHVE